MSGIVTTHFTEEPTKYMNHLQTCGKMQDWTEAQQAMGDTPDYLRDEGWHQAYEEMRRKMNTCTCGLDNLLNEIKAQQ